MPIPGKHETDKGETMADLVDLVKKTMLTGVGLALKGKDEVEAFLKDFEEKLDLSEKDGKQFIDDFQQKYEDTQKKLEDRVEKAVRDVMKKADVVTSDELKALKKEIRELKKAIGKDAESAE